MCQQIRKVLVPVDGSDCSRAALAFACDVATKFGASVDVLNVIEGACKNGGDSASEPSTGVLTQASQELRRVVESVPHEGVRLAKRLVSGNPTERIVQIGERDGFDLIVLGTHGRAGRVRSFAGSVAESVVRTAHCPVMTVRE